jgi:hypothetical protein
MAIGSARSDFPDLVTQATSGENPSTCYFSTSSLLLETNIGKYAFSVPFDLNLTSR